jgi:1-acyl-sn-glycerol-3-phosphate acyltransferase
MSNHTSLMDFVLYLLLFWDRTPRFLMAEVLFSKNKMLSWLLYALGGIYVNRDNVGFGFVSESLETLDKCGLVGVFPQGRLPVNGKPFPYKPGIAMIASRTDAPIIPIYTDGNYGLKKRAHVIFGEPIYLKEHFDCTNPSKEDLQAMTDYLSAQMDELKLELNRQMTQGKKQSKVSKASHPVIHPRYLPLDMARILIMPLMLKYRTKKCYLNPESAHKHLKGGAIVVANHTSFEDPLFINSLFWYRRNYFLAGEVLMDRKVFGKLLHAAGCIRIDRNISDIDAIRTSVAKLKQGHLLAMFPQGGIKRNEEVNEIKTGAILIAMQAGVPIIPVYSKKQEHWYQRRKAVIGEPFFCHEHCKKRIPTMTDMEHLSALLLEQMQACEKEYR